MHRLHGDLPVPLELAAAVALRWRNGLDGVVSAVRAFFVGFRTRAVFAGPLALHRQHMDVILQYSCR